MVTVFRVVLKSQLSRGRIAALTAIGIVGLLLAVSVRRVSVFDRADAAYTLVLLFGLQLLVPVTSLVFASAALGDPVEDRTLVYLWLRPLPRWQLAASAWAASLAATIPFGAVATVLMAAATGVSTKLVVGALVASVLATAAYTTLFLCLGLVVKRALVWGLAYVLIWEGFVARSGTGVARLAIQVYARSVLARMSDHRLFRLAASMPVSVIVPLAVSVAAIGLTTYALTRVDVA